MREVSASEPVDVPAGFLMNFLANSFGERHDGRAAFTLSVRLPLGVRAGGSAITKDVDVALTRVGGDGGSQAIGIRWAPRAGGAFPAFLGRLRAEPVDDTHARLHLEGQYVPPGGALGGLFDRLAGRRIALATLRQLLENVRAAVESDYRIRLGMAL